ncbi:nucleolar protein 16 [Aedes albopictus]|uniref:Nucleolar protein 16 n=1 Tax=Aedes albopictus TaxID=7160 RepID=A0ABM1YHF1_AEDAL|nr:LOW QUALITY PROTEIN: nucleolar protein 16-like [Aedes albopictus]
MVRRLRKTKKSQKYNYNRNRKRLNKKIHGTGTVKCPEIKNDMDFRKNLNANISEMGLAFDVNKTLPVPNAKRERTKLARYVNGFLEEDASDLESESTRNPPPKIYVAERLEKDSKEFVEVRFRLSRGQVRFITGMIDAYGFNYKAMAQDKRNYDQETWRQMRQKVRRFLTIPQQCTPYLKRKGWLDCDMSDSSDPRWKEYGTDDEE